MNKDKEAPTQGIHDLKEKNSLEANKNASTNQLWRIVYTAMLFILGPFWYGSLRCHLFLRERLPAGYHLFGVEDFPQLLAGMIVFGTIQKSVLSLSTPFFKNIVKG